MCEREREHFSEYVIINIERFDLFKLEINEFELKVYSI